LLEELSFSLQQQASFFQQVVLIRQAHYA